MVGDAFDDPSLDQIPLPMGHLLALQLGSLVRQGIEAVSQDLRLLLLGVREVGHLPLFSAYLRSI